MDNDVIRQNRNTIVSTANFLDMIKEASNKRKRTTDCEADDLLAAKRPRMMTRAFKRFEQKCWEWKERRRKIALGIVLYWEAQMRVIRRMARKRASSEMYADYVGLSKSKYMKLLQETQSHSSSSVASAAIQAVLESAVATVKLQQAVIDEVTAPAQKRMVIKRLSNNAEAMEAPEVKVTPAPRRNGWRRKGEKRI